MKKVRTKARAAISGFLSLSWLLFCCQASAQTTEYYHLDALGSVRAVTNQTGVVIERNDYLPFGEECLSGPCASNPSLGAGQPKRFTGKERDPETALDYFGARYYESRIGRFTTVDPVLDQKAGLLDPQRWNRYAYASNNPLRYIDPDGREQAVIVGDKTYMGGVDGMSAGDEQARDQVFNVLVTTVSLAATAGTGLAAGGARQAAKEVVIEIVENFTGLPVGLGVDFTADLSRTAARSRSGHSYAANKQLHEAMTRDAARRAKMEAKYGPDVLERTSTSGGGRRNPRGAEWDHSSTDPNALDLRPKEGHLEKTRREGQAGGGWKRFHRDKQD